VCAGGVYTSWNVTDANMTYSVYGLPC